MNELVQIKPGGADVDAYRASTEAAELCKAIVVATSSTIQNRRYVSVEGWQAIARAHGCAAGARDVEKVSGGVRAIGEIRDILTGQLVAQAEGFVGEDEPTWYGGEQVTKYGKKDLPKRADYAIRAMAQTRAMSRACRSAFAHVVVMMNAGLATTPAEEVPHEGFDPETGEITEKVPGIHKIKQRLGEMMKKGDALTDLAEFKKLVHANRVDIKEIRDANHEWWKGDGDDWEGFSAWMQNRYDALTPVEQTLGFQMLASALAECDTRNDLQALLDEHGAVAEALDGEESRQWEELYNAREATLMAVANVGAG